MIKGESYFLDEVSENKYIVKRFIRDFIWKKHESKKNHYMKYIFVGHLSVMLELYFKWLIDSKYIHEDLVECSALSDAGVFGIKDHIFTPPASLTESIRFVQEHKSEFEKLLSDHKVLVDKLRKSDPSVFIVNHKQDFLNIY